MIRYGICGNFLQTDARINCRIVRITNSVQKLVNRYQQSTEKEAYWNETEIEQIFRRRASFEKYTQKT